MGELTDKTKGIANEVAGRAKQAAGDAANRPDVQAEGEAQEAKGEGQNGDDAESASICGRCTSMPFITWIAFSGSSIATCMCIPKISSRRATYCSWSTRLR